MQKLLVVEDDAGVRNTVVTFLELEGYQVDAAGSTEEALRRLQENAYPVVITDIYLDERTGLDVLEAARRKDPECAVILMTARGSMETVMAATRGGAFDYIAKPFDLDVLLKTVKRAEQLRSGRPEPEEEADVEDPPESEMIGSSPQMVEIYKIISRVAPTDATVLVEGETGTGKELVARMIHRLSGRASGPFVVLNCATMRPESLEVELFGVERGANANSGPKVGLFERAHGGTLFLDEISDMPLETQGKIVRALQEQTFRRVGGSRAVEVDVRVISSSNRNLAELVRQGRLREDLYYRLNVVPIQVPPLHARLTDIPALACYFMERAAAQHGLSPRPLGEDVMAALQAYNWPGNVRQLRNVIEWLLIMAPGEMGAPVRADMLPAEVISAAPGTAHWEKSTEIMTLPLREAREVFEREYLAAQVTRFGGNISKTAHFVGMERSALHRKLKLLGIATNGRGRNGGN